MALIKIDYEGKRLQPTPAGHHQLATTLFLSLHDILKKEIQKKSWKWMKKDLEKKWP
jgi:hypothetical protein